MPQSPNNDLVKSLIGISFFFAFIFFLASHSLFFSLLMGFLTFIGFLIWLIYKGIEENKKAIVKKKELINEIMQDAVYHEVIKPMICPSKKIIPTEPIPFNEYIQYWSYELYTKRNERSLFGFTNSEGRVFCHYITVGNPDSVMVDIHYVISVAKKLHASGLVNIHNHFSRKEYGPNLLPSYADIVFSLKLLTLCLHNDIKLHGAYITSRGQFIEYLYRYFKEANVTVPASKESINTLTAN